MVYAMLQAKLSIPGIGGSTRIITLAKNGVKQMKSWSVKAVQDFFGEFDANIRTGIQSLSYRISGGVYESDPVERLLAELSKETLKGYLKLKKELEEIEKNENLL